MAIFNPDLPVQPAPNYQGLSQPVSQMESDKTSALTIQGLANTLGNAIGGADTIIKSAINEKVYSSVDKERGIWGEALETMAKGPNTLTGGAGEDIPDTLADGLNDVDTITAARAAGKVSRTQYIGNIREIAKNLRATLPGYREYIDQKIAQVTGFDPANKYLDSLIQDINRNATGSTKERTMAMNMLKEGAGFGGIDPITQRPIPGLPAGAVMWQKFNKGEIGFAEVSDWYSKWKSIDYNINAEDKMLTSGKLKAEDLEARQGQRLQTEFNRMNMNFFETMKVGASLQTGKDIRDRIDQAMTGGVPMSQQDAIALRQNMDIINRRSQEAMWTYANTPGADGRTPIERMGKEGAKKVREMMAEAQWMNSQVANSLTEKTPYLAGAVAARTEAQLGDIEGTYMQDPKWRWYIGTLNMLNKRSPEGFKDFMREEIGKGLDVKSDQFVHTLKLQMMTNPPDPRKISFNEVIEQAKQKGPAARYTAAHFKDITDVVDKIADVRDPETAHTVAWSAFGPKNRDFLKHFETDGYDENGNWRKGKFAVFEQFTRPEITARMVEIGRKDPVIFQHYVRWAQNEFRLRLFNQEINTLANIRSNPNMMLRFDPENNRFEIKFIRPAISGNVPFGTPATAGRADPATQERHFESFRDSITRLNQGLSGMGEIAKASKGNVSAFLISELRKVDPEAMKGTMSEEMLNEIIRANTKPEKPSGNAPQSQNKGRGSDKTSDPMSGIPHFTSPDRNMTLGDWLQNPSRSAQPARRRLPEASPVEGPILGVDVQDNPQGLSPAQFDAQRRR